MSSPLEKTIASFVYLQLDLVESAPTLMGIPVEVRKQILIHLLSGSTMVNITKTERGCKQRRRGLQSILIVNKQLRIEGTEAFFEATTFTVSHFQLHSKFKRMNQFSTLEAVQKLYINWAAPTSYAFTTIHAESKFILGLQRLKKVTIDYPTTCKGLDGEKTLDSINQFPRWLKQILNNKERKFTVNLVVYFLTGLHKDQLFAVVIDWDEKVFLGISGSALTLYETERQDITVAKRFRPKWKRRTHS